jgi:hypothetical protein
MDSQVQQGYSFDRVGMGGFSDLRFIELSRPFSLIVNWDWKTDAMRRESYDDFTIKSEYLIKTSYCKQVLRNLTTGTVVKLTLNDGEINLDIAAHTVQIAEQCKDLFLQWYPKQEPVDHQINVTFWYNTPNGPVSTSRNLDAPAWKTIENNYTARVRDALDALITKFKPSGSGQLLLWNGPPGTGKTFALRALAREWKSWCDIYFITDPDNLLSANVAYLFSAVLGNQAPTLSGNQKDKWRLIILEDSGELMTPDARMQVGQGLSRLLNLVDGLIGQGLKIMVLLTTNEPLQKLHPAVARPGRCASHIEFAPLQAVEIRQWLHEHGMDASDPRTLVTGNAARTLAEVYDLTKNDRIESEEPEAAIGFSPLRSK